MFFISLVLENLCLSTVNNEDIIYCTKVYYFLSFIEALTFHFVALSCANSFLIYWPTTLNFHYPSSVLDAYIEVTNCCFF